MAERISGYSQLRVYTGAFDAAMAIFTATKSFPPEERYSMVDQIRRSSRSVCTNIAEAWRKRRYRQAFIAKLSDAEGESSETQVWLQFADRCGYMDSETARGLHEAYESILAQLVRMIEEADKWLIKAK